MTYGDFKDLPRTASDKTLPDKAFDIAIINLKCDGYQRGIASMVYKCFDKNLLLTQEQELILTHSLRISTYQKNYTYQISENLKNIRHIRLLRIAFSVLI